MRDSRLAGPRSPAQANHGPPKLCHAAPDSLSAVMVRFGDDGILGRRASLQRSLQGQVSSAAAGHTCLQRTFRGDLLCSPRRGRRPFSDCSGWTRLPPTRPALSALGGSGPFQSPQAHKPTGPVFNMPTDVHLGNLILPYLGLAPNSKWRGLKCAQMHTQQPPGQPPIFASEVRLFVGSNPIQLQKHATEVSDVTLTLPWTHTHSAPQLRGKEPTYLLAAPPPMSCPSL